MLIRPSPTLWASLTAQSLPPAESSSAVKNGEASLLPTRLHRIGGGDRTTVHLDFRASRHTRRTIRVLGVWQNLQ